MASDTGGQGQNLIVIPHDCFQLGCCVTLRPDGGPRFADRRQLRGVAHEDELDALSVSGLADKPHQVGVNHRGFIDNHGTILGKVKRVFRDGEFLDFPVGFQSQAQQRVDRAGFGLVLVGGQGIAEDLRRLVRRGGEDQSAADEGDEVLDAIGLACSGIPTEEEKLLFGIAQKVQDCLDRGALFKCESHYANSFSLSIRFVERKIEYWQISISSSSRSSNCGSVVCQRKVGIRLTLANAISSAMPRLSRQP